MPDQGLNIFRDDKVLLGFRQNKRQIRQRTGQMSAAARRQAGTEYVRHTPGLSSSNRHFSRKVVGADEKRIVEKNLGSRRRIVGIIQTHQRVSQERYDQTARVNQVLADSGT